MSPDKLMDIRKKCNSFKEWLPFETEATLLGWSLSQENIRDTISKKEMSKLSHLPQLNYEKGISNVPQLIDDFSIEMLVKGISILKQLPEPINSEFGKIIVETKLLFDRIKTSFENRSAPYEIVDKEVSFVKQKFSKSKRNLPKAKSNKIPIKGLQLKVSKYNTRSRNSAKRTRIPKVKYFE